MQSIFKRLPIILAPPIGGYMMQIFGIDQGMKIGFVVSIVMAIFAAAVQKKLYLEKKRIIKQNFYQSSLEDDEF